MVLSKETVGQPEKIAQENAITPEPTKAEILTQILARPGMKFVNWKELMLSGVVVELHIKRTRFTKKLKYEDLGITFADAETKQKMEEIFSLGMKRLLPEKKWEAVQDADYNARRALEKNSVPTVWGRFVPCTSHAKFLTAMEECETAYKAAQQDILDNYQSVRRTVFEDHATAARNAYRHLHAVNPDALSDRERVDEERYIHGVRMRLKNIFPKKSEIEESFSFEVDETFIDLPSLAEPKAPTTTIEEMGEAERLQLEVDAARQRQTMIEQMNREVVDRARAKKQDRIDSFLQEIVSQVRGITYEACTDVLASLKSKGKINPQNINQLKHMIENINKLNFYGDADVERAIKVIKNQIDVKHEDRSLSQIEDTLGKIALVMRSTLLPLEYEFRETREEATLSNRMLAGIPEEPTRDELREARMALEMSLPDWELPTVSTSESDARFDRSL